MKFSDDIKYIKGVGETRAEGFRLLGVSTVGELLRFYPRAYEDWSKIVPISQCIVGENVCIKGTVMFPVKNERVRGGMLVAKATVTDGEDVIAVTFFNNKYIEKMLKSGEEYLFYGKFTLGKFAAREMVSPMFIKAEKSVEIRPIYPQNKTITTKIVQSAVQNALNKIDEIPDYLPDYIIKKFNLVSLDTALRNIHFPIDDTDLQNARNRLIFDELFILQLSLLSLKKDNSTVKTGNIVAKDFSDEFFSVLPFTPTNAQKRAVKEAVSDMQSGKQMNRLLQGDVGSGKTAVAAAIVYNVAKSGMQSALMAPTEVLATQHFETFEKLFKGSGIRCELLTGSTKAKEKKEIKNRLENGEIDLIIGTHALIQDDVVFKQLGLVITDEQHRFGVKQRTGLCAKGDNPHVYVMSATPIPRTLGLIMFGDLNVSILDELPPGRQKIETYSVNSGKRGGMFDYIRKHLDAGYQAYIVCPLVEESEMMQGVLSAEEYYKKAQLPFKDYKLDLLHGQMSPKKKDEIMLKFKSGETQLLISTVVIEVGVDVPNAVIMVIENAERFGLSQLHQLRGRVGRGQAKSTCILVTDATSDETMARMKIMCETTDGFKIADEDLKLRGPGDFFGTRQHGLPKLRIADILTDTKILMETQELAKEIMAVDKDFKMTDHQKIGRQVMKKVYSLQVSNTANTI
ncbi:MAG: ATP-dependent DNA helicase RecG [Clostridia bacterium]|nr:ATP-dependent DNA helicase RecG [Clostridia bacterium]